MDDGIEVLFDGTDPLDPADDGGGPVDTDGDGLDDATEARPRLWRDSRTSGTPGV